MLASGCSLQYDIFYKKVVWAKPEDLPVLATKDETSEWAARRLMGGDIDTVEVWKEIIGNQIFSYETAKRFAVRDGMLYLLKAIYDELGDEDSAKEANDLIYDTNN